MGLKKLLVFVGIFVVMPAYFLYTPIPEGYSMTSACKMQLKLAALKTLTAVVSTFSGIICYAWEIRHFFTSLLIY